MKARPAPISATAAARNSQERGKERKLRTRKRQIVWWTAVAFAAAAAAAPAPQALGTAPDDRQFSRGDEPTLSPDDRAVPRTDSAAPTGLEIPYLSHGQGVTADDLGIATAPKSVPVSAVAEPRGFDWGDALIGGAFGLALALVGTGAILIGHRIRSTPRPV